MAEQYEVAYTISYVNSEIIEAESIDEAQKKWEDMGLEGELFFIRNIKTGKEVVYD